MAPFWYEKSIGHQNVTTYLGGSQWHSMALNITHRHALTNTVFVRPVRLGASHERIEWPKKFFRTLC